MRNEMKPGDIVLVEQASGPGMTVRYRLPRSAPWGSNPRIWYLIKRSDISSGS
jgi:hypothetical protein